MNRVELEKAFWDTNALDKDVDKKYISDISTEDCLNDLQGMFGEVLEIGCGVGRLMKKGYWGIDISTNMQEIANTRKPECGFKHCDGRTIPFDDDSFDSVYCYLVFQHIPKDAVDGYIKEAYRVLKKGGTFIFQWIEGAENEPFSKHYSKEDMNEMTKMFSGKSSVRSKAYEWWTITRCIK